MKICKKLLSDDIFSLLIVLLPFLCQYKGVGSVVSLGELLLIPFMVWYLIKDLNKKKIKSIDGSLLFFYFLALLMTLLNVGSAHFSVTSAATGIARLFYYMVLVYVGRFHFRLDRIKPVYLWLVFAFSAYLIVQYVYHHISGGYLPIYLNYNWQFPPDARPESYSAIYIYGIFRPSSLFLEASYFAMFVLPGIVLLLFDEQKQNIRNVVILLTAILAIILSTSSAGIIGLAIIFMVKLVRDKNGIRKTWQKIGVLVIGVISIAIILYSENTDLLRSRLASGGSIGQRVLRGFIVFDSMNVIHKIIGVGMNNMEEYMIKYNIATIFDESNLNNCASIIQSFVYFGVIGGSALVAYIISFLRKSKGNIGFPLAVLVIYILSYEATLFMYRFAFLMILLEGVNRNERENKKIKYSN